MTIMEEFMPKYDMYCAACDREYNIRATMTEKAEKRIPCPDCGSYELETRFKAPPAYVKGAASCPQVGRCGASCPHAS